MRFGHVVRPIISVDKLCADPSESVAIHDSGLILVHVRQEADWLNKFQTIIIIHTPSDGIAQARVINCGFLRVTIYGFIGFLVVIIHISGFNTTNSINHAIEGKKDIRVLPDGWTAVSKDKKLTCHYENTVVVTSDGVEIITSYEGEE